MESANNTRNPTLGVVQNVRLSFGPITLTLHIQVINYAPFEVLLRQPFFTISSCITEDGLDGDSFITLRDPNMGERAKFVTHVRRPRPPLHLPPPNPSDIHANHASTSADPPDPSLYSSMTSGFCLSMN